MTTEVSEHPQTPTAAPAGSTRHTAAAELLRGRLSVAELVNTICHDVRATLAVTAGSATELASPHYGALSETQQQLVDIIQRGNGRLTRLANNLMYFGELWDGEVELRPSAIDLRTLVQQAVDELRRKDGGGRARLTVEMPKQPVEVVADAERTRQALLNPLSIALSAARQLVTVTLACDRGHAFVRIEDDGPERSLNRARRQGLKRISSNELALAISEALMGIQGGSLLFESPTSAAGGSRVTIELPAPAQSSSGSGV